MRGRPLGRLLELGRFVRRKFDATPGVARGGIAGPGVSITNSLALLLRRRRSRLPITPQPPPWHDLDQYRAREVAAADCLLKDTAVLRPSGAHLHPMLHRLLRAVHTVVTPGRFVPRNRHENLPKQPCPVRTCVSRNVRTPRRLSSHSSKRGPNLSA